MIAYLDTQVAIRLAGGRTRQLSSRALTAIHRSEILVSPMVLLEVEYLHEIGRSRLRAADVLQKLEYEIQLQVCQLSFAAVAKAALHESWTRDPFDRTIVAQAKANGLAMLISADVQIADHYPRAVW